MRGRSKGRIGFRGDSAGLECSQPTRQDRVAKTLERKELLIAKRGVIAPWPPCLVVWEDAQLNNQWEAVHDLKAPLSPVITRGFLIHKDEEKIVVALSVCEDKSHDVGGSFTIPLGCVLWMSVESNEGGEDAENEDDEDDLDDAIGTQHETATPENSDGVDRHP